MNHIIGSFNNGEINYDQAIAYMKIKSRYYSNSDSLSYFLNPLKQRAFIENNFVGDSFSDIGWDVPMKAQDIVYSDFRNTFDTIGIADNPAPPEGLTEQAAA